LKSLARLALAGLFILLSQTSLLGRSAFFDPLLAAQEEEEEEPWKKDPYTDNDPEKWKAAGYTDFGRFLWAGDHGTTQIEKTLGAVEIIWLETEHFQLGCSLNSYKIPPDKIQKKKILAELDRLREKLPTIPKKVRVLNPWLRAHLYAQRLEDLWAEYTGLLGVSLSDFPDKPGRLVKGHYMGEGKYLGQKNKFAVMIVTKESTLGRYCERFANAYAHGGSKTHNFAESGSLFYGTCTELAEGYLSDDSRLHCNVIFGVTKNLLLGLKGYIHSLPLWFTEGLAHWYVDQIDERYHMFSKTKETFPNGKKLWKWRPRIKKLAKFGPEAYPSGNRLFEWSDLNTLAISHHMMFWSKVDYLLTNQKEAFGKFILGMNDRIFQPGVPANIEKVLQYQKQLFTEAFGVDYEQFEALWADWVLDEYPTK